MLNIITYILQNPQQNTTLSIILAIAAFFLIFAIIKKIVASIVSVIIILVVFNMMWGNVLSEANLVKIGVDCNKVPCSRVVRIIKDNSEKLKKYLPEGVKSLEGENLKAKTYVK